MKPYKSSSDKDNCSPISSNCVIWQGPNISCINLCKGDSVSEIIYKLGVQICQIKDLTNITDLELDCILNLCTTTQQPELTLAAVLQLIIDKVCCTYTEITTAIENLASSTGGSTTNGARINNSPYQTILNLPSCLQYVDPITEELVTALPLPDYVLRLASEFCSLKSTVTTHTSQISNLDSRVTVLEDAPCCYTPPVIIPSCTYGGVTEGVTAQMDDVVSALDGQYCQLVAVLGSNTQLLSAAGSQCQNLGALNALSQSGTMGSLAGWNNTINNVAQSLQNLWITVCDMRGVINDLKNCCGSAKCSSFFLGFTVGSASTSSITLFFNTLTTIPGVDYLDCPTLSSLKIDDGNGHIYDSNNTANFSLITASTDSGGVTFDITAANLDDTLPWTITVTGCIENEAGVCSKTITSTYPAITPPPVVPPCHRYTITASGTELSAATGNTNTENNGVVYASYYFCDSSTITTTVLSDITPTTVCVKPGMIPFLFYFVSDVLTPCVLSTAIDTLVECAP